MSPLRRSLVPVVRFAILAFVAVLVGCYSADEGKSVHPAVNKIRDGADLDSTETSSVATANTSNVVTLGDPSLTAGIPGDGELTLDHIDAWLATDANHVPLDVQLPLSLAGAQGMIKGLDENPMTRQNRTWTTVVLRHTSVGRQYDQLRELS